MPIIDDAQMQPTAPDKIKVAPDQYKNIIHDVTNTSAATLISHIEGSKWPVTYYLEKTTVIAGVSGKSSNMPPVYQSYDRIENLELRVQNALDTTFDPKTGALGAGSALMYPGTTPNPGNIFTARIGDGRYGVFQVTTAEPKTLYLNTAYLINYQLLGYLTKEYEEELKKRVLNDFVFVKSFMDSARDPVILKSEYQLYGKMQKALLEIKRYYCEKFFSKERNTFLIPNQPQKTIDTYLNKFLLRILSQADHPHMLRCRNWSTGDAVDTDRSIWDAIIERDKTFLYTCFSKAKVLTTRTTSGNTYAFNLRYSGIDQFIAPSDREDAHDASAVSQFPASTVLTNKETDVKNMMGLVGDTMVDQQPYGQLPIVTPFQDLAGYYIVSEAFYTDLSSVSSLEAALADFIENKPVPLATLSALVATYHGWGTLERFYYLPIVMAMLTVEMTGMSY